jgi:predicted porin
VTAAARQPWANSANNDLGFDAKAVYSWTGDVSGKVWVSGITQKTRTAENAGGVTIIDQVTGDLGVTAATAAFDNRASAIDIGANINIDKANLVAYYYDGKNMGLGQYVRSNTIASGLGIESVNGRDREVQGGYAQATYVIPTGTKLGVSYGLSKNDNRAAGNTEFESKSWIVGAYHPLTKSLNLVAEYIDNKVENNAYVAGFDGKAKTAALGAILFF